MQICAFAQAAGSRGGDAGRAACDGPIASPKVSRFRARRCGTPVPKEKRKTKASPLTYSRLRLPLLCNTYVTACYQRLRDGRRGGFGDAAFTCTACISSPPVVGRTAATQVAPRCWRTWCTTRMMNAGPGWTSGPPHCFKTQGERS